MNDVGLEGCPTRPKQLTQKIYPYTSKTFLPPGHCEQRTCLALQNPTLGDAVLS